MSILLVTRWMLIPREPGRGVEGALQHSEWVDVRLRRMPGEASSPIHPRNRGQGRGTWVKGSRLTLDYEVCSPVAVEIRELKRGMGELRPLDGDRLEPAATAVLPTECERGKAVASPIAVLDRLQQAPSGRPGPPHVQATLPRDCAVDLDADLIAPRSPARPGVILELKVLDARRDGSVDRALDSALLQVREKAYAAELKIAAPTPFTSWPRSSTGSACGFARLRTSNRHAAPGERALDC